MANVMAEKNIAQSLRHPFLVNLQFAFQTQSKLYMVLDYMAGGELFFWLSKSANPQVRARPSLQRLSGGSLWRLSNGSL
jgi:serine/threonine protein kinase